jgi:hypothetical protein
MKSHYYNIFFQAVLLLLLEYVSSSTGSEMRPGSLSHELRKWIGEVIAFLIDEVKNFSRQQRTHPIPRCVESYGRSYSKQGKYVFIRIPFSVDKSQIKSRRRCTGTNTSPSPQHSYFGETSSVNSKHDLQIVSTSGRVERHGLDHWRFRSFSW